MPLESAGRVDIWYHAQPMLSKQISPAWLARLCTFALMVSVLLGCTLQPASSPSTAVAPDTSAPAANVPAAAPAQLAPTPAPESDGPTTWTVGLLDEPSNLLPFSPDGRAAAPIVEAMFPAPVLGLNYTYTTTGVLETLPSPGTDDVRIEPVSGFLDASGHFTLTETTEPTTTEQLAVTFHWSKELRWADGEPVTAADSVFAYTLYGEVQAPQEAELTRSMIERYEQVDQYTTRAVLKPGRVDPTYLLTAWPPLPRHRLADLPPEEALAELEREPLGYGPYTFGEQLPGEQVVLIRNDYSPGHERLPEQLIFRFFARPEQLRDAVTSGEIDVGALERVPPELYAYLDQDQQSGAAEVRYLAGPVYEHLDLNLADIRLQDVRVRQALAYAIDRQGIATALFGGKVAPLNSWILPEQQAFYAGDEQLTRYPHDVNKARSLLDEAGLTDRNGDGIRDLPDDQPFRLTILTTDTPLRQAMAARIAESWSSVGIQVETEVQPIEQLYSPTGPLYRRTFQTALFGWVAGVDPGGLPLWSCNAVPIQENGYTGNNFAGWCFEAAEWPLRRANSVFDVRVRAQEYLKQQRFWTQELPVIPLLQRPLAILHHPSIQGVQPDPLAPVTWNIAGWRRD